MRCKIKINEEQLTYLENSKHSFEEVIEISPRRSHRLVEPETESRYCFSLCVATILSQSRVTSSFKSLCAFEAYA